MQPLLHQSTLHRILAGLALLLNKVMLFVTDEVNDLEGDGLGSRGKVAEALWFCVSLGEVPPPPGPPPTSFPPPFPSLLFHIAPVRGLLVTS